MPHREFLEAARSEKSDITLQALCDRLLSERDVKADTSMMSPLLLPDRRKSCELWLRHSCWPPPSQQVELECPRSGIWRLL